MSRPEILAPAGNREMLGAAVFSGADAVYLGLTGFNARRTAGNFTPEELREAVASCNADAVAEELGDLLFAAVKVARFAGVDPEQAAHAACEKFIRRFAAMEAAAADSGVPLEQRTLAQMQPLWQQAKQTAGAHNKGKKSARQ